MTGALHKDDEMKVERPQIFNSSTYRVAHNASDFLCDVQA